MSLTQFNGSQDGSGDNNELFWHRAEQDGAPFRGPDVPLLTEEEFESSLRRVSEAQCGIFDLTNIEQATQYLKVVTRISNNWYECLHVDRWVSQDNKPYVRIEWLAYFMELPAAGTRQGKEVQIEPGKQRNASQIGQ